MGENRDVYEISASKRQWAKNGSGVKILGRHTEKSKHGPAEIRLSYLDYALEEFCAPYYRRFRGVACEINQHEAS
jgi:hypothetical protein